MRCGRPCRSPECSPAYVNVSRCAQRAARARVERPILSHAAPRSSVLQLYTKTHTICTHVAFSCASRAALCCGSLVDKNTVCSTDWCLVPQCPSIWLLVRQHQHQPPEDRNYVGSSQTERRLCVVPFVSRVSNSARAS